ncbi:unnamed protein product [Calypogeia fissa]
METVQVWTSNSSMELSDNSLYSHRTESWPGLRVQEIWRTFNPAQGLTGHHSNGLIANKRSTKNATQEDGHGRIGDHFHPGGDNMAQQFTWESLPGLLPHQASSFSTLVENAVFQHPPLRNSSAPRYERQTVSVTPSRNLREIYEQRKEMIARHHWKLSNQNMTFSNAYRCTRMLIKHHWKLHEVIANLEQDGEVERQLLDWLIWDHAVLLNSSKFVLAHFELFRMPFLSRQ